ncbi:hypothetical protein T265_03505 [Opisthorchis viverrini]|uniref:Peptidase A1 domain-containing protein n=1 Tax=Opisthorchis viverrini TaxID=6198 RepID=A0A074ZVW6_OPIVI|nr:hypothetical protein T265_03505 [Opisthorchis viverrini]KER30027.1 hypothetical protein T265_03505 [Opisthorchis viverrini]
MEIVVSGRPVGYADIFTVYFKSEPEHGAQNLPVAELFLGRVPFDDWIGPDIFIPLHEAPTWSIHIQCADPLQVLVPEKILTEWNTKAILRTSECESVSARECESTTVLIYLLEGHCLTWSDAVANGLTLERGCDALHIAGEFLRFDGQEFAAGPLVADLSLTTQFIWLDRQYEAGILQVLGAGSWEGGMYYVACDRIANLPRLIFDIEDDSVYLTPDEYILKCLVAGKKTHRREHNSHIPNKRVREQKLQRPHAI